MREWTHADQVRKVKFFLRDQLERVRLVRLGHIHPPDWMDTPRERARMLADWQNKAAELRVALFQIIRERSA